MKKIVVFVCFVCTVLGLSAGVHNNSTEIPVVNGKIVFSDTIATMLHDNEIHTRLQSWYKEYSKQEERTAELILNDSTLKVMEFRFVDHMVMEKKALMIYSIYMRYTVRIIYANNLCVVRVNRISYLEPENIKDSQDRRNPLIPAENILVDRKYKVAFVKDPIEKIEKETLLTVENLFKSITSNVTP